MNSFNSKKTTIIDLQGLSPGQDVIFIKDRLLYVLENGQVQSSELKVEETYLINGNLVLREIPVVYSVKQVQWDARDSAHNDNVAPTRSIVRKTSFLVFKNQKYTTVQTNDIAFFYVHNDTVSIRCFNQQEFTLNQSLDQITGSISSEQFFRVNRKYLINFKAIKEVEHYFLRQLFVKLLIDTPDKLLINKQKARSFLSWMSDR